MRADVTQRAAQEAALRGRWPRCFAALGAYRSLMAIQTASHLSGNRTINRMILWHPIVSSTGI